MGGNLFKRGRLPKKEYLVIETKIRSYLDERFGADSYRIPRYYGTKTDFGDVDILLSKSIMDKGSDWVTIREGIVRDLGIQESKGSGKVFSTLYMNFQVDFFLVDQEIMESQSSFMDFNDLGNFLGRIFRSFNLKYSHQGLYYIHQKSSEAPIKEFLVSRDWEKILAFLELDYNKWKEGFYEIEEMFEWLLASPYFRSAPYRNPESRIVRTLAKQRNTTQRFVAYLEGKNIERVSALRNRSEEALISRIEGHFPESNLSRLIAEQEQWQAKQDLVHRKFNGRLMMEWNPQLKGKELGRAMHLFRQKYSPEKVMTMTSDEIKHAAQLL